MGSPFLFDENKNHINIFKTMYLINNWDKNGNTIPITHKCDEADIGKPMTEAHLHEFAVGLVMVYYYQQGGDIKFIDYTTGIESPHIVMENKEKGKYYYVTIKAGYSPNIPELLTQEHYTSLIKLAKDAGATPVFIGVVFEHVAGDGQTEVLCCDQFIVEYTGLIQIVD